MSFGREAGALIPGSRAMPMSVSFARQGPTIALSSARGSLPTGMEPTVRSSATRPIPATSSWRLFPKRCLSMRQPPSEWLSSQWRPLMLRRLAISAASSSLALDWRRSQRASSPSRPRMWHSPLHRRNRRGNRCSDQGDHRWAHGRRGGRCCGP